MTPVFVGFLVGKGTLATLAAMAMRFPSRVGWLAGVGLAQFGEFGFVLSRLAEGSGVIDAQAASCLLGGRRWKGDLHRRPARHHRHAQGGGVQELGGRNS